MKIWMIMHDWPNNRARQIQRWLVQQHEARTEHKGQPELAERNLSQQQYGDLLSQHCPPLCATSLLPLQTQAPKTSKFLRHQINNSWTAILELWLWSCHPFVAKIFHTLLGHHCISSTFKLNYHLWIYLAKQNVRIPNQIIINHI